MSTNPPFYSKRMVILIKRKNPYTRDHYKEIIIGCLPRHAYVFFCIKIFIIYCCTFFTPFFLKNIRTFAGFTIFYSKGYPPPLRMYFLCNNVCKALRSQPQYNCIYICIFFPVASLMIMFGQNM